MPDTIHPDVAEVLAYNKASCKHLNQVQQTRLVGGRPGVYGGTYPQEWTLCSDCETWTWCSDCETWIDIASPYNDLIRLLAQKKWADDLTKILK